MIDPKLLRSQFALVKAGLAKRNTQLNSDFESLEENRKTLQAELENKQAERNQLAKLIGKTKAEGVVATDLFVKAEEVKQKLETLQTQFADLEDQIQNI